MLFSIVKMADYGSICVRACVCVKCVVDNNRFLIDSKRERNA